MASDKMNLAYAEKNDVIFYKRTLVYAEGKEVLHNKPNMYFCWRGK
jgi:hypothetical protein